MNHDAFRILRVAPGEDAGPWAQVLLNLRKQTLDARLIKEEGGDAVWACTLPGRRIIVKRRLAQGTGELARRIVGLSRAQRQWRGSELLDRAAIPTARCLALARASGSEWLVMEELAGCTLLAALAEKAMPRAGACALAIAAGRLVASMAAARLFNRDQKPSNIVVTELAHEAKLALIDTVGVRRARTWRGDFTVRMLASLVIEPLGVGISIPRTTMMRALRQVAPDRAQRHALWRHVGHAVREHGDPTPRINPLAAERPPSPSARRGWRHTP